MLICPTSKKKMKLKLWTLGYGFQLCGLLYGLVILNQAQGHYAHVGRHVNAHGEVEQSTDAVQRTKTKIIKWWDGSSQVSTPGAHSSTGSADSN